MSRLPTIPLAAFVVTVAFATGAFAQKKPMGKVIEVRETTVIGRVQKPVAAQEIGKMPTRLQSSEPKKSFLDRIEGATSNAPF
jgi:hypothetical protein